MRFVIDDAPWAINDISTGDLEAGLDALADVIGSTQSSGEQIGIYADIWKLSLVGSDTLYSLLYDSDNPRKLARTVRTRLARQLDKIAGNTFDESSLSAVDAEIQGVIFLAPAAVHAWQEAKKRSALACISPTTSGRKGPIEVLVNGAMHLVHFVFDEVSRVSFFRDAIRLENADEPGFASLAPFAFPNLRFVDGLWRGLRDLSQPYRARRDEIIDCLATLSDDGSAIFALKQNAAIEREFSLRHISISPENSETIKDSYCRRARTREYANQSLVFDWHIKIEPHIDRIHIHPGTETSDQCIIVGIIHKHLPLPGD